MNTKPKESDQETDGDDPEVDDPAQPPGSGNSGGGRRRRKRRKRVRAVNSEDFGEIPEPLGKIDAG